MCPLEIIDAVLQTFEQGIIRVVVCLFEKGPNILVKVTQQFASLFVDGLRIREFPTELFEETIEIFFFHSASLSSGMIRQYCTTSLPAGQEVSRSGSG